VLLESAGVPVRWVTIEDDGIGGECRHAALGTPYTIDMAFEQASFALGAFLAEERARHLAGTSQLHYESWSEFLDWYADGTEDNIEFIRSELECGIRPEDEDWGDDYDLHKCLRELARSGEYGDLRTAIEALLQYTSRVVDEHWSAIEAVAERLVQSGYLSDLEIRPLIRGFGVYEL